MKGCRSPSMRNSFFFTSAKMSVKPGSGVGDHSFSQESREARSAKE